MELDSGDSYKQLGKQNKENLGNNREKAELRLFQQKSLEGIRSNLEKLDLNLLRKENGQSYSLDVKLKIVGGVLEQAAAAGANVQDLIEGLDNLSNKGITLRFSPNGEFHATINVINELKKEIAAEKKKLANKVKFDKGEEIRFLSPSEQKAIATSSDVDSGEQLWSNIVKYVTTEMQERRRLESDQDFAKSSQRVKEYIQKGEQALEQYKETMTKISIHDKLLGDLLSGEVEYTDGTLEIEQNTTKSAKECRTSLREISQLTLGYNLRILWEFSLMYKYLENKFSNEIEELLEKAKNKVLLRLLELDEEKKADRRRVDVRLQRYKKIVGHAKRFIHNFKEGSE